MILHLQFYFLLLLGIGTQACHSEPQTEKEQTKTTFKDLLIEIREESISPEVARSSFQEILADLKEAHSPSSYDSLNMDLVFPLRTKNYRSVGGKGRGFFGRHFNLFNHTVANSHPAHDIFIYDLNRDSIDDNDETYVDVLAVNDGIVIATEQNWTEDAGYRGGNYVWLYDFKSGGLWYYAHQREVFVVEGQLVKQGDKLGEVGRTGFNAETNRSDTHLHLMFLKLDKDNNPTPINHYPWLKKARTIYTTQLPEHYPRKVISAMLIDVSKPKLLETSFKRTSL